MFNPDGTFSFYHEITAIAEQFCEEWEARKGAFKNELEAALVFSFALNTIKYDLEIMLNQLEKQPVFKGISPIEVYQRGQFGAKDPRGLDRQDIYEMIQNSLHRFQSN
jgi:hypothetical protein